MKIKREINGVEYEFELTSYEMYGVHLEIDFDNFLNEFEWLMDEDDEVDVGGMIYDTCLMEIIHDRYQRYMDNMETSSWEYDAIMEGIKFAKKNYPELISKYIIGEA